MPIYEYECQFCNHKFQLLQGFNEPPPKVCPSCGREGGIRKLISPTMFELKGTGWYVTDYKNSGKSSSESAKESTKKSGTKSVKTEVKEEKSA